MASHFVTPEAWTTIDSRIAALEEANKRLSDANRWLRLFVWVPACAGILTVFGAAQPKGETALRATKLVLVNEKGATRAELRVEEDNGVFVLMDGAGKERVRLATGGEAAGIAVLEKGGNEGGAELRVEAQGPRLVLLNATSKTAVSMLAGKEGAEIGLMDESGKSRVELAANITTSGLYIRDPKGKLRAGMGYGKGNGLSLYDEDEKKVVGLSQDGMGSGLQIHDVTTGMVRARIGHRPKIGGEFLVADDEGIIRLSRP
jgi:hypothetical protein